MTEILVILFKAATSKSSNRDARLPTKSTPATKKSRGNAVFAEFCTCGVNTFLAEANNGTK